MSTVTPQRLLACALATARAAGQHALRNWRIRRGEVVARMRNDIKLALDIECQRVAEDCIRRRFPNHHILGEEDTDARRPPVPADCYEWIIDPIDGTLNFSHGLPLWCCSIAVRRAGRALAGVVYAPAMKEIYAATARGPATRNGRRIAVSRLNRLADAMIATGLDKDISRRLKPMAFLEAISASTQRARILGTAALDMCRVAAGQLDGYFETGIYIWDVAAGGLIVERAGGRAEIMAAMPGGRLRFLATNGRIHAALRRIIATAATGTGRRK